MQKCNWKSFSREVLALYAVPLRRPATARKMRQVLAEFGELCQSPSDLSPLAIAGWIASHLGRRPETVCTLLRSLRAACTYGESRGLIASNPFHFRGPAAWIDWDVPELPPPVHSAEEISRVLELADREAQAGAWKACRLRAIVYTFAFTGARKREVLALAVADIDLDAGVIRIRTNRRRGLKTRKSAAALPIPPLLRDVLEAWIPCTKSEWLFPGAWRLGPWLEGPPGEKPLDQVELLGIRAGVPGLTISSFRHTFASLAEGWSIGELALQRQLRHTRLRTQLAYRHPLPEVLRGVAAKVSYRA